MQIRRSSSPSPPSLPSSPTTPTSPTSPGADWSSVLAAGQAARTRRLDQEPAMLRARPAAQARGPAFAMAAGRTAVGRLVDWGKNKFRSDEATVAPPTFLGATSRPPSEDGLSRPSSSASTLVGEGDSSPAWPGPFPPSWPPR